MNAKITNNKITGNIYWTTKKIDRFSSWISKIRDNMIAITIKASEPEKLPKILGKISEKYKFDSVIVMNQDTMFLTIRN
jgi:hypothetical protein